MLREAGYRPARLAKLWLDVAWWFGVGGATVVLVVLALSPFVIRREGGLNVMAVTVALKQPGERTERALASDDADRAFDVVLEERPGAVKLAFITRDVVLFVVANFLLLPAVVAMLYWVHLLRSMLRAVLDGSVFTDQNAGRLSRLGWLLIAICLAVPMLSRLRSWFVLNRVRVSGADLAPFAPELPSWGILVGLLLLSLAAVWRYGVELQRERELTV